MKEPDMFDDPLVNELAQSVPAVPAETKFRLLYECGVAAAETKMRNQRRRHSGGTLLALVIASGIGFLVGNRTQGPAQQIATKESVTIPEGLDSRQPQRKFSQAKDRLAMDKPTLTVAMTVDRVIQLLDQTNEGKETPSTAVELALTEKPLSTISFLNDLE